MERKMGSLYPGRLGSTRLKWVGLLVVLVLVFWPGRVVLVSALQSGIIGEVRLQGRTDHSDVAIELQGGAEGTQTFGAQPAQVTSTDAEGVFSVSGEGVLIITARKAGYLDAQATVTISGDGSEPLGPTTLYGGEVTRDNLIDISDLAYLGAHFGSADTVGDINGDGQVDILDLSMAAANFKMSGPTPWGQ